MISAWETTFEKKIGLFEVLVPVINPLAAYDDIKLVPRFINVKPHLIWLQLISEMVDTVKYCSREKVKLFCILLDRSLPILKEIKQHRQVHAIGCRFKLLQCGLSLLQGNTIPKSLARNLLRERIYSNALDYFCGPQVCPNHKNRDLLLDDILILLKFWQTMRSEKKYLIISEIDASYSQQNIANMKQNETITVMTGSEFTRSMSSSGGGWYNTIPHSTSTLSKRTIRSKRMMFQKDSYDKDYMKKRNLILELLAVEIEFLLTWYNPNGLPDLVVPGEEQINEWRNRAYKVRCCFFCNFSLDQCHICQCREQDCVMSRCVCMVIAVQGWLSLKKVR